MDSKDVRAAIGRPQIERLKALGTGIVVDQVMGTRLLIKTVIPYTDADRLEKEGLLYVPQKAKEENTPMPSTGIVVAMGPQVSGHKDNWDFGEDGAGGDVIVVGSMVLFSKFAGVDFIVDTEDFKIIELREVMCTLTCPEGTIVPVKESTAVAAAD